MQGADAKAGQAAIPANKVHSTHSNAGRRALNAVEQIEGACHAEKKAGTCFWEIKRVWMGCVLVHGRPGSLLGEVHLMC